MFLASRLRLFILGEPLLRPSQPSPFQLFMQETRSNVRFDIYLLVLLVIACLGLALAFFRNSRDGGNALLYAIGFLLIFCSYNLQKVIEANRMLNKSVPHTDAAESSWSWRRWIPPWGIKLGSSLRIAHGSSLLSNAGLLGLPEKTGMASRMSPYAVPHGIEQEKLEGVNPSPEEASRKSGSLVTSRRESPGTRTEENPSIRKRDNLEADDSSSDHQKSPVLKIARPSIANRRMDSAEKKEALLGNLMKIFQLKVETDESLQRHVLNLKNIEMQVNKILEEFTKVFKIFMKEAEKIESEMVGFNASTRYLNISLNELKVEIKKYFSNLPKSRASREIPNYLSTLARNYHNNEDIGSGDMGPMIRYESCMMFLLAVQMVLCLLLFLAALAKLDAVTSILRPVVSVGLVVVTLLSAVFLLSGQMLDRSCKSGSVRGCSFTPALIDGVKRLEVVSKADDLEDQLDAILKETGYVTEALSLYVKAMMDTRVNAKMSVFSNLFNKILFVYDDFGHLTKKKVDKNTFYGYIKIMSRLLENIASLLEFSEQKDMVDIYVNERAFLFWLNADKGSVVESIREITEAGPIDRSGMPPKWCVNALQGICDAKDSVDALFLLTLIGGPIFLFLLYL
ncbi:hypothetical protein [Encephalitozoon cuniculi GB-M1]|uniref:Uncharacterized protein n=1 Tax=Encephalitozoon cuniculi (strain GB-M1) TaxID=284813 RepID=Q8SW03_ENCCU|nr:uncharacterized protein ECU03_1420 [Encephalitozoon cuniculi GB-M1]CAD26285.1 hypothetical protein [Encephalitozoon cuniculi GB-M1]